MDKSIFQNKRYKITDYSGRHAEETSLCLLCILTSFGVLRAPEIWLKYFFEQFSIYFLNFKCFLVIFHLKSRKKLKNRVLSYSLKLVQIHNIPQSIAEKDDFDQQRVYKAAVCWSKNTAVTT